MEPDLYSAVHENKYENEINNQKRIKGYRNSISRKPQAINACINFINDEIFGFRLSF
jgi:hypothetical protein